MCVQALHERAVKAAGNYLNAESDLIEILRDMSKCRGYLDLRHKSLFRYAVDALKLSRDVAYTFCNIAEKARDVPKLYELIRDGNLTVSNARRIVPILTVQNQEKWLGNAVALSKNQLEKALATEFPKLAVDEKASYITGKRLKLQLGVSEELYLKYQRAQELVSTKQGKSADLEATLEALLEVFLDREDPVRIAERAMQKKKAKEEKDTPNDVKEEKKEEKNFVPGRNEFEKERKAEERIPAALKHRLTLRDQSQCTTRNKQGVRCPERKWLHFHHIVFLSNGGQTTYENLTTLCSSCHRLKHHLAKEVF
jgi:5-methylcytosine-specific restriction endonuclease McrA